MILNYILMFLAMYIAIFYLIIFIFNSEEIDEDPHLPEDKLPGITVLVPAYNEEETIAETIESLLKLDYPENLLEIIVINDGSKDNTSEIAKRYIEQGIRVIDKENGGKATALNIGIENSSYDFIATVDADSFPDPRSLRNMIGYLSDPGVMAVSSTMRVFSPKKMIQKLQMIEYITASFMRKMASYLDGISVTPGPLSLYRKTLFEKLGGFDRESIVEDQEIIFRAQKEHYKIRCSLNAVVYTKTPEHTFRGKNSLMKQRLRWYRGTIRNLYKYRHLLSSKYGDFGVFIVPISFVFLILSVVVIAYNAYMLVSNAYFNIGLMASNMDIALQPESSHFMIAMVLIVSLIVLYLSVKYVKEDNNVILPALISMVIYGPLLVLFWILSFLTEILGTKVVWKEK